VTRSSLTAAGLAVLAALASPAPAPGSDCTETSTGRVPLTELGTGLYLGQFQGGLYPGGVNAPPADHQSEGLARAAAIEPLDAAGNPDPNGRIALVSIGMCNTSLEFCGADLPPCAASYSFMGQALADARVDKERLVLVNGAAGGQTTSAWDETDDPVYDRVRDQRLAAQGLTEQQVQVAWVKLANAQPSGTLPAGDADAFLMLAGLGDVVRSLRIRYPNLQIVYLSSRIYAGYASTTLNPEPFAYESGFAVKWLIEAQIEQMRGAAAHPRAGDLDYDTVAPWLAWGPYLWADGLTPRAGDGFRWACSDFSDDGTHPAEAARQKVGEALLDFLVVEPTAAPWFLAEDAAASCQPTDTALCLTEGRFRVETLWTTGGAAPAPGHAVPLRDDTGAFWFFDEENLELMVKVLDACVPFGRVWVFAGGSTDVGTLIRVTELETGEARLYESALGAPFVALRDTSAFPCTANN
jgi:hypothetical protein